jgi:hypothetical protein
MENSTASTIMEAPVEHSFRLHKTSIQIRNLGELSDALEIMSQESFGHHVNDKKNDFAVWVREVLHDDELAGRLRGIGDRKKAYEIVKQRIREISYSGSQSGYKSTLFGFGLWDVVIGFFGGLIVGLLLGHFLIPTL